MRNPRHSLAARLVLPVNILLEIDRAHPPDNLEVSHTFIHDVAKDNLECLRGGGVVDRVCLF